jgi:undecaprenyl-diphosphatase
VDNSTDRPLSHKTRFRQARPQEIGLLAALFAAAGLILVFGLLAEEVMEGDTLAFDRAVIMAFRTPGDPTNIIGPPWVEEMGRDITALGSFAFLGLLTVAVVGYLLLIRKRAAAALVAVAVLGGSAISTILKMSFDRSRPELVLSARVFTASFPSGHATLSAITFLTLGALMTRLEDDRRVKVYLISLAVFLTILVGVSRVYLGLHYPTDVLAGWCIGSAWATVCWVTALWLQDRGKIEQPGR